MTNSTKEVRSDRIIFFGDSNSFLTSIIFSELVKSLEGRGDFTLAGIVDTANNHYRNIVLDRAWSWVKNHIFRVNGPCFDCFLKEVNELSLNSILFVPEGGDITDSVFLEEIRKLKPTVALVVGCPKKFSNDLLRLFEYAVNYHDSLLPKYRGLKATPWSVYFNEKLTGYSFHLMNEKFDEGNIVIQEALDVNNKSIHELNILKARKASKNIDSLLDLIKARDRGRPQKGVSSYYGMKDFKKITSLRSLTEIPEDEMLRRIRAFGGVMILDKNYGYIRVTDIEFVNGKARIKKLGDINPRVYIVSKWLMTRLQRLAGCV